MTTALVAPGLPADTVLSAGQVIDSNFLARPLAGTEAGVAGSLLAIEKLPDSAPELVSRPCMLLGVFTGKFLIRCKSIIMSSVIP